MTAETRPSTVQTVVAVLSLPRSGSSLLARILHEVLGVDFGEPVEHIPSNRNNPDGYYENARVLDLAEEILAAAGSSVFEPPPVDYFLRDGEQFRSFVERARAVLDYSAIGRPLFGIKDPRLCLTFPIWKAACPSIVPLIIFRDPGASALSVAEQSGLSLEQTTALWFPYYFRTFDYSAGLRRHVTSFERLLSAPQDAVRDLAARLGLSIDEAEGAARLSAIVDPRRVRHGSRAEPVAISPYIDPTTKVLYSYLSRTVDEGQQPDYRYLGAVLSGLEQYERHTRERRQDERLRGEDVVGGRDHGAHEEEAEQRVSELAQLAERLESVLQERDGLREEVEGLKRGVEQVVLESSRERSVALDRLSDSLRQEHAASVQQLAAELRMAVADADELRQARHRDQESLSGLREAVARARDAAKRVAAEFDLVRGSRTLRLHRRLLGRREDLWPDLSPQFRPIRESRCSQKAREGGFRLTLGPNLQRLSFREYPLPPGAEGALSFAFVVDVPGGAGQVGMEIVSPDHVIVAQASVPLAASAPECIRAISAAELPAARAKGWRLRLFVKECDSPVRPIEFQRSRAFGLMRPALRAFCAPGPADAGD